MTHGKRGQMKLVLNQFFDRVQRETCLFNPFMAASIITKIIHKQLK